MHIFEMVLNVVRNTTEFPGNRARIMKSQLSTAINFSSIFNSELSRQLRKPLKKAITVIMFLKSIYLI